MLWDLIKSYRQAFRIFIRTKTRPMTVEEAEEKRLFWAKIYGTVGVMSLFYCTYMTYKKGLNFDYRKDVPKDRAVAEVLASHSKKIVVFDGFKKVKEYELNQPQEEESQSSPS